MCDVCSDDLRLFEANVVVLLLFVTRHNFLISNQIFHISSGLEWFGAVTNILQDGTSDLKKH